MKKRLGMFAMILCIFLMPMIKAEAAEGITLLLITDTAEVMDSVNGENVLVTLETGTAVFYGGEEKDGWTKIVYQDVEGYVLTSQLQTYGNQEALDREFKDMSNNNKLLFEEVSLVKKEERQSLIWGIGVAVIVLTMFGVSIISGVRKDKEDKKYKPIYKGQKRK